MTNVPSASHGARALVHSPSARSSLTSSAGPADRQLADDVRREVRRHRRVLQPDLGRRRRSTRLVAGRRRRRARRWRRRGRALRDQRHRIVALGEARRRARRGRARAAIGITVGPPTSTMRPSCAGREAVRGEQARADVDRAIDERRAQPLERVARRAHVDVDRAAVDLERAGQRERAPRRRATARSSRPRRRACSVRSGAGVLGSARLDRRRPRARELGEHPVDERPVEVAAAEEVVAVVADHAQQAVARLEQRRVERAAAEVVDEPRSRSPSSARQPAASAEATGSWSSSTRSKPASRAASEVAALCGSSNSAGTEITARAGDEAELVVRCPARSALQHLGRQLLGLLRRLRRRGTRSPGRCPSGA